MRRSASRSVLTLTIVLSGPLCAAPDKSGQTVGSVTCAQSVCHASSEPWLGGLVEQNEYKTWKDHDPHSSAGMVLTSKKAAGIAQRLGLGHAPESALCRSCHAPLTAAAADVATEGVGCEACHGPAKSWLETHVSGLATHGEIVAAGLRPLENAEERAKLCTSCHSYDGQGVTHRLLAAGHPQLEWRIQTLYEAWPAHHQTDPDYLSRKSPPPKADFLTNGARAVARRWTQGLEHSLRASAYPEPVFFKCADCHQDAKTRYRASNGTPELQTEALEAYASWLKAPEKRILDRNTRDLNQRVSADKDALRTALRRIGQFVDSRN